MHGDAPDIAADELDLAGRAKRLLAAARSCAGSSSGAP
jgi:hypothetical protein